MKYHTTKWKYMPLIYGAILILSTVGCNTNQKEKNGIASSEVNHQHGDEEVLFHIDCVPGKFPCDTVNYKMFNAPIEGFNLEKEIGFKGKNVRLRYWVIAPGGRIGQHYHDKRPAIVYFLEGEAYETKKDIDGIVKVRTVKADEVELESSGITHWWVNQSSKMVKLFAVDIVSNLLPSTIRCAGIPRSSPFVSPENPDIIKIEEMGTHDLGQQFPEESEIKSYTMRSRRLTLLPQQKTKVEDSRGQPSITYVIRGDALEHRNDEETSIRREGDCSTASNGVSTYWENITSEPVVLFIVDFVKKQMNKSIN